MAALLWLLFFASSTRAPDTALDAVQPNDNRTPAGVLAGGVLTLAMDARMAAWKPDLRVDSAASVQVFAERGKTPTIPGPLIRVPLGTEIRVSLRNLISDSTLTVYGLRTGTRGNDTVQVAPGTTREIRFTPAAPGTYLYWGTTKGRSMRTRWGRETQLNGALVVDAPGARTDDRILMMTLIDIYPDSVRNPSKEDLWELAINGLSWPHTERLHHKVADTLRWRLINATDRVHPMHLHGFHFRTLAKGDWNRDTTFAADDVGYAVTEFMLPGSTARIEWTPTRAGNWLFHCHMAPHITPYPERPDSLRLHDGHDITRHPDESMAGLVLGVTVSDAATARVDQTARHRARILVQQARADSGKRVARGFVIQRGATPARDSIEIPGSPLILYRGERTSITVVNNLLRPTTLHWHGMELESLFDGVSGWSGVEGSRSPLVMPGDSFTVAFTPPRAGTYMYHTHMDEEDQLASGLYAPMLVLEPGEKHDPARDVVLMFGAAMSRASPPTFAVLNGATKPPPLHLTAGTTYRLRVINIHPVAPIRFELLMDSTRVAVRPISKDGAALPPSRIKPIPGHMIIGVGETYDFEYLALASGNLRVRITNTGPEPFDITMPVNIRGSALRPAMR